MIGTPSLFMIGCKRKDLNIRGVPDFGLGAGGGDGQGADL